MAKKEPKIVPIKGFWGVNEVKLIPRRGIVQTIKDAIRKR